MRKDSIRPLQNFSEESDVLEKISGKFWDLKPFPKETSPFSEFFMSSSPLFLLDEGQVFEDGKQFRQQGKLQEARHCFHALLKNPTFALPSSLELEQIYQTLGDRTTSLSKKQIYYRQAFHYLEKAWDLYLKSSTLEAEGFRNQGSQNQDFQDRDAQNQEMLGFLWKHKGLLLGKCAQYLESGEALDAALRFSPTNLEIWNARGIVFLHLGQSLQAKSCFRAALDIQSNHSPSLFYEELLFHKKTHSSLLMDEYFLFSFFSQASTNLKTFYEGIPIPAKSLPIKKRNALMEQIFKISEQYYFQPLYTKSLQSLALWLQRASLHESPPPPPLP